LRAAHGKKGVANERAVADAHGLLVVGLLGVGVAAQGSPLQLAQPLVYVPPDAHYQVLVRRLGRGFFATSSPWRFAIWNMSCRWAMVAFPSLRVPLAQALMS
jgi:hypothetical protein